jgi:hypothetical protein
MPSASVIIATAVKASVLKQIFDEAHAPGVEAIFLHLIDAAETAQGGAASLLRVHSRRHVLLNLHLQMKRQLVREFLIEFTLVEEGPNAVD